MGVLRRSAAALIKAVVRLAPEESRAWAEAMQRELDWIESDWEALLWAIGGTVATLRHAGAVWQAWLIQKIRRENEMNKSENKATGIGLGVLSAVMLVACGAAGLRLVSILLPGLELDHARWAYWLAVMAIPEAIFVAATIALWRKSGPVAAGVLATVLGVGMHVAVHLSLHWQ